MCAVTPRNLWSFAQHGQSQCLFFRNNSFTKKKVSALYIFYNKSLYRGLSNAMPARIRTARHTVPLVYADNCCAVSLRRPNNCQKRPTIGQKRPTMCGLLRACSVFMQASPGAAVPRWPVARRSMAWDTNWYMFTSCPVFFCERQR